MIEKLKDFWNIFKRSRNEFYKEKNEVVELLERVKHLNIITLAVFEKNKEILNYLDTNIHNYPKCMLDSINDLVYLFKYGWNSKTIIDNEYSNFIYILSSINSKCLNAYSCIDKQFKQRNFKYAKDEYLKLIKDLRDYEEKYKIVVLDDFYDYDKI